MGLQRLESQFRERHRQSVELYEATLRERQSFQDLQNSYQVEMLAKEREAVRRIKGKHDESSTLVMPPWHDDIVARAIGRKPSPDVNLRRAFLQQSGSDNMRRIPVYASSILSPTKATVANVAGEHGNPWVLPWNPQRVKVAQQVSDDSYGLCGWARVATSPIVVTFYFPFLSDVDGPWTIFAAVDLFGYYVLNVHHGWLLCRSSSVNVTVSMNVYQYFNSGWQKFPVLHESSHGGYKYGFCNEYGIYNYNNAFLRADPEYYVFVEVSVEIAADAYGGFGEINFQDGEANYIQPLVVIAGPGS